MAEGLLPIKAIFHKCALALSVLSGLLSAAEINISGIRIARYHGDRAAAVSYTFDDGLLDQVTHAVPLLEKHGFKATFGLIAGSVAMTDSAAAASGETGAKGVSWETWKRVAGKGHEIANHSLSHIVLRGLDRSKIEPEVNGAYELIESKTAKAPISFIFPYNVHDATVRLVVGERHPVTRTGEVSFGGSSFTTTNANEHIGKALLDSGWVKPMIHGIIRGHQPFSSPDILDAHFEFVKKIEDRIWVAPLGDVGLYIRERDAATVGNARYIDHGISFELSTTLASSRNQFPLTIVVPAQGAVYASATQAGSPVPTAIAANRLLVDIVAGAGTVEIKLEPGSTASSRSFARRIVSPGSAGNRRLLLDAATITPVPSIDLHGRTVSKPSVSSLTLSSLAGCK